MHRRLYAYCVGVFLVEVCTLALQKYTFKYADLFDANGYSIPVAMQERDALQAYVAAVIEGKRPATIPSWWPSRMQTLVSRCFDLEPSKRPTMLEVNG